MCVCESDSYRGCSSAAPLLHCSSFGMAGPAPTTNTMRGEDLAGQSGILMIHMFISYLPTSTPFCTHHLSPRSSTHTHTHTHPTPPSSPHSLVKRMCVSSAGTVGPFVCLVNTQHSDFDEVMETFATGQIHSDHQILSPQPKEKTHLYYHVKMLWDSVFPRHFLYHHPCVTYAEY